MNASKVTAYDYIDSPTQLADLVQAIEPAEEVAVDTEANSLHKYHHRVCLVQLSFLGTNYIVDPLADVDLDPLLAQLAKKKLMFHAADYDLRMMRSTFGFFAEAPLFDTMIAAQLLGCEELGLVAIASRFLGVELTKQGQKSDWSRRPLTDAQLEYAADDTFYLEPLVRIFRKQLEDLNRTAWHEESCARLVKVTAQEPEKDMDRVWRIKGSGLLSQRELLFVRALWHWRDKEASKADLPAFKIVGNARLTELAQWHAAPKAEREGKEPALPRSCKGARYSAFREAVQEANEAPKNDWPARRPHVPRRPPDGPRTKQLLAELQKKCGELAQELNIAPGILASKATLMEVARHTPTTVPEMMAKANLMKWQSELVLPIVQEAI